MEDSQNPSQFISLPWMKHFMVEKKSICHSTHHNLQRWKQTEVPVVFVNDLGAMRVIKAGVIDYWVIAKRRKALYIPAPGKFYTNGIENEKIKSATWQKPNSRRGKRRCMTHRKHIILLRIVVNYQLPSFLRTDILIRNLVLTMYK